MRPMNAEKEHCSAAKNFFQTKRAKTQMGKTMLRMSDKDS
jgi:hypothetical protein